METVNFKIPLNPYDEDVKLYSCSNIELHSGLTVLVGCNGAGKSTLLRLLKDKLMDRQNASVLEYNDRTQGGTSRIGEFIFHGDTAAAASMMMSSEGERIHQSPAYCSPRSGIRFVGTNRRKYGF